MRRAILMLALLAAALWSAPALAQSAQPARAALHHRHHAGRSDDRRLQQDHRAESVLRREAGDDLFLARGRLEQEGQLHAGDRRRQRGDPPAARASPPTICAARPITTRASTTSPSPISTTRCGIGPPSGIIFHNRGNAWRGKGDYAKAIADYDQSIRLGPHVGVLMAEPRHLETGARRSRRRAGRYQRSDPARSRRCRSR